MSLCLDHEKQLTVRGPTYLRIFTPYKIKQHTFINKLKYFYLLETATNPQHLIHSPATGALRDSKNYLMTADSATSCCGIEGSSNIICSHPQQWQIKGQRWGLRYFQHKSKNQIIFCYVMTGVMVSWRQTKSHSLCCVSLWASLFFDLVAGLAARTHSHVHWISPLCPHYLRFQHEFLLGNILISWLNNTLKYVLMYVAIGTAEE